MAEKKKMSLAEKYKNRNVGGGANTTTPAGAQTPAVSKRVAETITSAGKEEKASQRKKAKSKREKAKEKLTPFIADLKSEVTGYKEIYDFKDQQNLPVLADLHESLKLLSLETSIPMKELLAIAVARFVDDSRDHSNLLSSF